MSTVTLVGAFGQGNPGDEALCAAFCEALADHDLDRRQQRPRRHGPASPRARRAGRRALTHGARAPLASDALVIGGGTIFKSLHPSTGRRPQRAAAQHRGARRRRPGSRRRKVAMIGVGADDLRGRAGPGDRPLARAPHRPARAPRRGVGGRAGRRRRAGAVLDRRRPGVAAGPRDGRRRVVPRIASRRSTWRSATSPATPGSSRNLATALAPLRDRYSVHLQPWQIGAGGRDLELADSSATHLGADAKVLDAPPSLDAPRSRRSSATDLVVGAALPRPRRRRRWPARAFVAVGPRAEARRAEPGDSARCPCPRTPRAGVLAGRHRATPSATGPAAAAAVAAEVAGAERTFGLLRAAAVRRRRSTSPSSSPGSASPTGLVAGERASLRASERSYGASLAASAEPRARAVA